MEIETVKNAMSRELDWDNYLICGVGDLSVTATAPNAGSVIDMNGDSHNLNTTGSSFNIAWNIPKKGKLFSVGMYVTTQRPHVFGNGHDSGYKLGSEAVLGCCKLTHIAATIPSITGIFTLSDSNDSPVFSWDSPAGWRSSNSDGGCLSDVPLSYELGVECDIGMKLSTSETYLIGVESTVASIGGVMFVPYKEV